MSPDNLMLNKNPTVGKQHVQTAKETMYTTTVASC